MKTLIEMKITEFDVREKHNGKAVSSKEHNTKGQ